MAEISLSENQIREITKNLNTICDILNKFVDGQHQSTSEYNSKNNQKMKKISLIARGIRYEISIDKLDSIPNSRLNKLKQFLDVYKENKSLARQMFRLDELCDDHDENFSEFYFECDPYILNLVVAFHENQSKKKLSHLNIKQFCSLSFENEMTYWGIEKYEDFLEPCCLVNLEHEIDNLNQDVETEKKIVNEIIKRENFGEYCFPKQREIAWNVINYPKSSIYAKVRKNEK
jgi:hypothetical protein